MIYGSYTNRQNYMEVALTLISFFLLRTMRKLVSLGDYFGTWKL